MSTATGMFSARLNRRAVLLLAVTLLFCAGWLWWLCQREPAVPILTERPPAEWIIYPAPFDANGHLAARFSCVFRRSFTLAAVPSKAELRFRVFKEGVVRINTGEANTVSSRGQNWKQVQSSDVAKLLRVGQNEISVVVTNGLGPVALWLCLEWTGSNLATDGQWDVSVIDGIWKKARLAREAPLIRAGNPLFGLESVKASLRRTWPELWFILFLSAASVALFKWQATRSAKRAPGMAGAVAGPKVVLAVAALFWFALFWNNLPQMPSSLGFDRNGHLFYIDYILHQKALPLAGQEFQTYQPPLYYLVSSLLLSPFHLPPGTGSPAWQDVSLLAEWHSNAALIALRAASGLIGILHVALIFLCLRRLFPRQPGPQVVGTLLAAFVPANLYLSHHVTNESLAALFVTAALFFCLRILPQDPEPNDGAEGSAAEIEVSPGVGPSATGGRTSEYAMVGVCLGLAMLTKFSALLALPVVFGALGWASLIAPGHSRISGVRSRLPKATGKLLLVLATLLVVCGWHYVRVWQHFGKPFVGNWDPILREAWWQEPGYRTASWYEHFGESFVSPLFSGAVGFADGIYSSLWGDGYCSGAIWVRFRPPWDYDLMNAGYLLALLPTALILTGLVVLAAKFLRHPTPAGFLLLGLASATGAGVLLMSLRVASYAQVKAFYGLPALLPFCAFAATGWQRAARRNQVFTSLLAVGILAWLFTVCGTFWIRRDKPLTWTMRGVHATKCGRYDEAVEHFSSALGLDRDYLPARLGLADSLRAMGRVEEAYGEAQSTAAEHPGEAKPQIQLGLWFEMNGQYEEARKCFTQALVLAPDEPEVHHKLGLCFMRLKQRNEAVRIYREGLSIHPLEPGLLNNLAWVLAASAENNSRNGKEAVRLAERACQLTRYGEPVLIGTLAAAYAEAGRFDEAIATGQQACARALELHQPELADKNRKLIELYEAHQPYHEAAPDDSNAAEP